MAVGAEILSIVEVDGVSLVRVETIRNVAGSAFKLMTQRTEVGGNEYWVATLARHVPPRDPQPVLDFGMNSEETEFTIHTASSCGGIRPYQVRDALLCEAEQKDEAKNPLPEDYVKAKELLTGSPASGVSIEANLNAGSIVSRLRDGGERWRFELERGMYICTVDGNRDDDRRHWLGEKDISEDGVKAVVRVMARACFPEKLQV